MFKHIRMCSTNTCFFFTMIRGVRIRILFPFFHFPKFPKHRILQTIVFLLKEIKLSFPFFHFWKHPADQKKRVYFSQEKGKNLTSFLSVREASSRQPNLHVLLYCDSGHKDLLSHLAFPATSNRQTCSNMFKQYVLLLHNDQGKSGSYFRPFISRNIEHIKQ